MTADIFAPWRQQAACQADPVRFDYFVDGETAAERKLRVVGALAICGGCPVAAECIADVDLDVDTGVRAGHMIFYRRGHGRLVPIEKWLRIAGPPAKVGRKRAPRELPREHGTVRGYYQHRDRDDLPACAACRAARSVKRAAS